MPTTSKSTPFLAHLRSIGACPEARLWVKSNDYTSTEAWENCEDPQHLLWWVQKYPHPINTQQAITLTACRIARTVLHLIPAGEDRPRLAIEAGERWANNPTKENKQLAKQARSASSDAAAYAAAYAASYAAAAAYSSASAYADAASCKIIREILAQPWTESAGE